MTRMDTGRTNQTIDQDRRRLLGAATMGMAVAGAASLLPSQLANGVAGRAVTRQRVMDAVGWPKSAASAGRRQRRMHKACLSSPRTRSCDYRRPDMPAKPGCGSWSSNSRCRRPKCARSISRRCWKSTPPRRTETNMLTTRDLIRIPCPSSRRGPFRSHDAGGAGRSYCPLRVGLHPSRIASCSHRNLPVLVQPK